MGKWSHWGCALITLSTLVVVQTRIGITVKEMDSLQIYYDEAGQAVPMVTAASMVSPTLKTPLVRFGPLPCSCQQLRCGCCVNMHIDYLNFQRQACTNFTYDPNRFAIDMNMLWNQQSVFNRSISGRNPPPVCIPAPIPYLPSIDQCVRLFNIHMPGYNMHMCMNLETRIERVPVLVMQFDCMQMGYDGVMLLKPEAEANQTMAAPEAMEETTEVAQEADNDPVDDDKKKVNQTSSVNNNSTNSEMETQGEVSDVKPEHVYNKNLTESNEENSTSSQTSSFVEATTINSVEETLVSLNQSSDDIVITTESINDIKNR